MPVLTYSRLRAQFTQWVLLALAMAAAERLGAQAIPSKEYQVKAVFLFNFAQFVTWPETNFASPAAPLVIGVLGEDPFGSFLEETVRGEKVNGHPLVVQRFHQWEDVKGCNILYVSRSEAGHLDQILAGCRDKSVLTVSDLENFAKRGGIIQFRTENAKIRLSINTAAAKTANLSISSKLLGLADLVAANEK